MKQIKEAARACCLIVCLQEGLARTAPQQLEGFILPTADVPAFPPPLAMDPALRDTAMPNPARSITPEPSTPVQHSPHAVVRIGPASPL